MSTAALKILSLGAGVQSTTLGLLAVNEVIEKPDIAIFADTGWEPAAVYAHLDRLEREVLKPAGIEVLRVTSGNIRNDALDPAHKFVSMPTFTINADGSWGIGRRQCTPEYKLKCIKKAVRQLLGYLHPTPVPRGVYAEQYIGISRDEFDRAKDSGLKYLKSLHPLLYLSGAADGEEGWTRTDCRRYLRVNGWGSTPRSACIGCPFRTNREWREMRDQRPQEWADAVAFDHSLRAVTRTDGIQEFLHAARVPLDQAPIDWVTRDEKKKRQISLFDHIADEDAERSGGCGPWSCRSGDPVVATEGSAA